MGTLALCLVAGSLATQPASFGYLWPICADSPKQIAQPTPTPWVMQEGDLVFYSSRKPVFRVLYGLACSHQPYHISIVVRDRCGQLQTLEAGPDGYNGVILLDPLPRFKQHLTKSEEGVLWIRRLRCPLSPEQSRRLTEFAEAQVGKKFAWLRLGFQGTVFRKRSLVLRRVIHDPYPEQKNWFCSELVHEAMREIGLIPADSPPGNTIFPHHQWEDHPTDLRPRYEAPLRWTYRPIPITVEQSAEDAAYIPATTRPYGKE